MNTRPAQRVNQIQEYYFSEKLKEVAQLQASGNNIISLVIDSPDIPPSHQTIQKLYEVANDASTHGYQPTCDILELRQAMARFYEKWYDVRLNPQTKIQPLIGSKEGTLYVALAFCNPGDVVLVLNPGYPTYISLGKLLGVQVLNYDLREENAWQPDLDELEQMDLTKVQLMWTNYLHMPTGGNTQLETYEKLVALAQEHNIVIVNDNPYLFILNDRPLSIMQVEGAKDCCIEFNSISKSFNMLGWRVDLCASNTMYILWTLKVKSNIDSGTFRGVQLAAAETYNTNDEIWHYINNVKVHKERREITEKIMQILGCSYDHTQMGMFLWGRIPAKYKDAEQFTERVLHKSNVLIAPGFTFSSNGKRYVRISLCAKEIKMNKALIRLQAMAW